MAKHLSETEQAVKALTYWFMTQDIPPTESVIVMSNLTAKLLVWLNKGKDAKSLTERIRLYIELLNIEIEVAKANNA